MITKIFLILLFLLPGCRQHSGLSEYARSMAQCEAIVRGFGRYAEEFKRHPTGVQLEEFIKETEGAVATRDWSFGGEHNKYIAYKSDVGTRSGSNVTIVIYRDGSYDVFGINAVK